MKAVLNKLVAILKLREHPYVYRYWRKLILIHWLSLLWILRYLHVEVKCFCTEEPYIADDSFVLLLIRVLSFHYPLAMHLLILFLALLSPKLACGFTPT